MKKKLSESMEVVLTVEPNLSIVTENMLAEWGGIPYSQLSVVLVHLKFLAEVHQNHHWTCMSDPFYGDHLLFARIYDATKGEIDSVAEKSIGMGSVANVDLHLMTSQLLKLVSGYGMTSTIPQSSDLARRSLLAEMNFLKVIDHMMISLDECGMLSNGIDNMLQGIADVHEGHVYLLKQRCTKGMY
jgi:DNA-binding ferritin-like protein